MVMGDDDCKMVRPVLPYLHSCAHDHPRLPLPAAQQAAPVSGDPPNLILNAYIYLLRLIGLPFTHI